MGLGLGDAEMEEGGDEPVDGEVGAEGAGDFVEERDAVEGGRDHDVPHLANLCVDVEVHFGWW